MPGTALTVYGATGYTGRLISQLLVARGVEFTIAGRSRERLESLSATLAASPSPPGSRKPEIVVASLDDTAELDRLVGRSRVVLSCAGPFVRMGPPMIDACLRAGAHYLDITGEVRFMIETAARDAEARARGVVVANAVGFDVVPSDFVVYLAAKELGGDVDSIELAMAAKKAKASGGTQRSIMNVFSSQCLRLEGGRYIDEPVAAVNKTFPFPAEFGDRNAVSAPIGDLSTAPRTSGAKNVRTFMALPPAAGTVAKIANVVARAVLRGPVTELMESLIPPSGEGPSLEDRKASRFAFFAEAVKGGRKARATITGADGYGLTAETAALAATVLMEPGYDRRGALSPMQAVDPDRWRPLFERWGCQIKVGSLE